MIIRTTTIGFSVGLHTHPASLFTQIIAEYDYDIVISLDDEKADAVSTLEVMALGAKHDNKVTLSCEDDSATAVLDEPAAMLGRDLDAEQTQLKHSWITPRCTTPDEYPRRGPGKEIGGNE